VERTRVEKLTSTIENGIVMNPDPAMELVVGVGDIEELFPDLRISDPHMQLQLTVKLVLPLWEV
jgi:hypothetical protein